MQVTFTNPGSSPLYIASLYLSLPAGASVTTRRSVADLERDQELKKHVVAGTITLAFAEELGDDAQLGLVSPLKSYSDGTRPAATAWPVYASIWNTSDNAPNWSDGTNWRSAAGAIT